jgi:hypothetical protein
MLLRVTSVRWRCSSVSRSQSWSSADGRTIDVRGGEQRLRRLVTRATSLDYWVFSFDPFRQPKKAGQRDYGGVRRFL